MVSQSALIGCESQFTFAVRRRGVGVDAGLKMHSAPPNHLRAWFEISFLICEDLSAKGSDCNQGQGGIFKPHAVAHTKQRPNRDAGGVIRRASDSRPRK